MTEKAEIAKELFSQGFNCAQAVFCAFAEDFGISRTQALKLSASFGGGVGRMGDVCGVVSGMVMVLGLFEGNTTPEGKLPYYEKVQKLIASFSEKHGGYVCRDLLATGDKERCADFVASGAEILETYLKQQA